MGEVAINNAIQSLALCNHWLEKGRGVEGKQRLAFVPVEKVLLWHPRKQSAAGAVPDEPHAAEAARTDEWRPPVVHDSAAADAQLRRCIEIHLRLVSDEVPSEPASSREVIRVAAGTDTLRLSGLLGQRWSRMEIGALDDSGIFLHAVGPRSVRRMVVALAVAWQNASRSYECGTSQAGFAVLPTPLVATEEAAAATGATSAAAAGAPEAVSAQGTAAAVPAEQGREEGGGGEPGRRRVRGVQCVLVPPAPGEDE